MKRNNLDDLMTTYQGMVEEQLENYTKLNIINHVVKVKLPLLKGETKHLFYYKGTLLFTIIIHKEKLKINLVTPSQLKQN